MRLLAAILLSLVAATALFVAGFAALHGLGAPQRETSSATHEHALPAPVRLGLEPIDVARKRVDRGQVAEAAAQRPLVNLRCIVHIPGAARAILLARSPAAQNPESRVLLRASREGEGRFAFEPVPAGVYELRITSERGASLHVVQRLDLFADRELEIREALLAERTIEVASNGKPLQKAYLILEQNGVRRSSGTTDQDGRLQLRIAAGAYDWRIWSQGEAAASDATINEARGSATISEADSNVRLEIARE